MASLFSSLPVRTTATICSSSNLLVAIFMQHLASHPTSGSPLTTSSPLPTPLTVTSHQRSEGTNASSCSSSYLHSWCIPHNLLSVAKSPVWRLSSRILQAISYSSDHPKTLKIFYCRNGVLATNNISTANAPHQRCQQPTKGALLLAPRKRTRDSSGASFYRRSWSLFHDFLSVTMPTPHKIVLGNLTTC